MVFRLKPMGKPTTSKTKFWTEPRYCMVLGLKPMGKPTTKGNLDTNLVLATHRTSRMMPISPLK